MVSLLHLKFLLATSVKINFREICKRKNEICERGVFMRAFEKSSDVCSSDLQLAGYCFHRYFAVQFWQVKLQMVLAIKIL